MVDMDFFYLAGVTPSAKGLALALSTIAYKGDNTVHYSDTEICHRLHISRDTYKKYMKELEEAKLVNGKTLTEKYFPLTITNTPIKERIAELRIVDGSERMQKQLDWLEQKVLNTTPSLKLNQAAIKLCNKIETGTLNYKKAEKVLKEILL